LVKLFQEAYACLRQATTLPRRLNTAVFQGKPTEPHGFLRQRLKSRSTEVGIFLALQTDGVLAGGLEGVKPSFSEGLRSFTLYYFSKRGKIPYVRIWGI
jgi:hypothetical protein